jgi:hypothetical protein
MEQETTNKFEGVARWERIGNDYYYNGESFCYPIEGLDGKEYYFVFKSLSDPKEEVECMISENGEFVEPDIQDRCNIQEAMDGFDDSCAEFKISYLFAFHFESYLALFFGELEFDRNKSKDFLEFFDLTVVEEKKFAGTNLNTTITNNMLIFYSQIYANSLN